jgi:hypothetical protein
MVLALDLPRGRWHVLKTAKAHTALSDSADVEIVEIAGRGL